MEIKQVRTRKEILARLLLPDSFVWCDGDTNSPIYRAQGADRRGIFSNPIVDILGKIWALPNTALGIAVAIIMASIALINGGGISFGNNGLQVYGLPFADALTIGNVILYNTGSGPRDRGPYGNNSVFVGPHEQGHTYQNQLYGIFFFPAYLLSGPIANLNNPFEQGAQNFAASGSFLPAGGGR